MANSIEYIKSYTDILDEVYQKASVSKVLDSGRIDHSRSLRRWRTHGWLSLY